VVSSDKQGSATSRVGRTSSAETAAFSSSSLPSKARELFLHFKYKTHAAYKQPVVLLPTFTVLLQFFINL